MPEGKKQKAKRRDVERALEGVLNSEQFSSSEQLSEFLSFIVNKTLDGKSAEIKAYSIAVDALGRRQDFDPQSNAAVRVAAGRLRQALALYNSQAPQNNAPVTIILEPGSYVPIFEVLESPIDPITSAVEEYVSIAAEKSPEYSEYQSPSNGAAIETIKPTPSWPPRFARKIIAAIIMLAITLGGYLYLLNRQTEVERVVQKPVGEVTFIANDIDQRPKIKSTFIIAEAPYPKWYGIGEVSDSIELTLARFDDFKFIGAVSDRNFPLNDQRKADYHLLISAYPRGDNVRMYGKLIREKDGVILWSSEQLFTTPASLDNRNVPKIAGKFFAQLASPYGVIYTDLELQNEAVLDRQKKKLPCLIATYRFNENRSKENFIKARACLDKLIDKRSKRPSVYAAMTILKLQQYVSLGADYEIDHLSTATKMAKLALRYNPQSARAHQANFRVHRINNHQDLAKAAIARALILNPYDTSVLGDYGSWLIAQGQYEKGKEAIHQAETILGTSPNQFEVAKFIAHEMLGEFTKGNEIASHLDYAHSPLNALCIALAAHRQNNNRMSKSAIEFIKRSFPKLAMKPRTYLVKSDFSQLIAEELANKLLLVQQAVAAANQN